MSEALHDEIESAFDVIDGGGLELGFVNIQNVFQGSPLFGVHDEAHAAFRAACRNGLRVHRVGKRAYIAGADLAAFITRGGAN